ncbi:MAG: integrase core domain-containing protein, partial [Acidimicrobiales bacterium]
MAMCAIAQHFGRPGTPTDQAWIESLFSHIKADWPHLDRIRDPEVLRAELAVVRHDYNTVRLHAGIGCVTLRTSTRTAAPGSAPAAVAGYDTPAGTLGTWGLPRIVCRIDGHSIVSPLVAPAPPFLRALNAT